MGKLMNVLVTLSIVTLALVGVGMWWQSTQEPTPQEALGDTQDIIDKTQSVKPASIKVTAFDQALNTKPQTAPPLYAWKTGEEEKLIANAQSLSFSGSTSVSGWSVGDEANIVGFNATMYGDVQKVNVNSQTPVANIKTYRVATTAEPIQFTLFETISNTRIDNLSSTANFTLGSAESQKIKLRLKSNQTQTAYDLKGVCIDTVVGSNYTQWTIASESTSAWHIGTSPRRLNVNSQCETFIERNELIRLSDNVGTQEENLYLDIRSDQESNGTPPEGINLVVLDGQWFKSVAKPNSIMYGTEDDATGTPNDVGASDLTRSLSIF